MPYASDKRHGPAAKPAAAAKAAAAGGRKGAGNPAGAPPGKGSAAAAAAAKPADGVAPARKGAGASRGPAGSGPSPRAGGLAGDMSAQGAAAAKPETSGVSHRVRPDGSGPSPRAGGSAGDMGAQGAAAAKPETSGVSQRVRPSGEGSPDGSGPSPRAGGLAGGIAPSGAQGAAAAKPEKSGVSHRARPGGAGGSGNPEGSGPSPRAGGMAGPSGAHGAAAAKPEKSGVSHRGRPGGAGDPLESSRPADGSEPDSSELNRRFEGQDSSDIAAAAPPPGDWVTRDESDLVQIGAETSEEDPGGVFMTGVPASPPAHARKRTNRPVLSPLTAGGGSHTPQPPTRTESSSPVRRHPRAGHQGDDKAEKVVFIPKAPSIPSGDGANKLPELVVSQCEANDESDEAAAKEAVEGDVLSKFEGVLRERGTAKHKQKEIRATQLAAMQEKLRSAREDVDKRMQQDLEDRAAAEAERERERTAKRAVREDARQRRIRALGLRTAEGKYGHLPLHEAMSARYHCEVVVPAMEEQREKLRELRRKFDAPTDAQRAELAKHRKEHDDAVKAHGQRHLEELKHRISGKHSPKYASHLLPTVLEEERRARQEHEAEKKEARDREEKKRQYARMVSELRRPKVKSGSQSPRAAPGKSSTAGARSASAPAPRLGRKLGKEYLRQAGHLPAKSKRANRGESAGTVVETESEKEAREAKARRKLGNHYMSDASKLVSRGPDGSPIVSKEEHPVESLTAMRSRVKHLDRALESALQQASTNPDALSQQKQTLLACNAAKAKLVLLEQLSTAKTNP